MSEPMRFSATVLRVIDGDTLEVELVKHETIDWGFRVKTGHNFEKKMKIRLHGINTPETRGPKAKVEGEAGRAATLFVNRWLIENCHHNQYGDPLITLVSHDGDELAPGKYHGRWVAEIFPRGADVHVDVSLNEALVAAGHAERIDY